MSIYAQIRRARAAMAHPHKSSSVNAGPKRYKFAPLSAVLDAVLTACQSEGLTVLQYASTVGEGGSWLDKTDRNGNPVREWVSAGRVEVRTVIANDEGATVEAGALACPYFGGAQDVGIATTYARRYSLLTTFGLYGEDDADGLTLGEMIEARVEHAERQTAQRHPQPPPPPPAPPRAQKNDATAQALRRAGCASKADADAVSTLLLERPCPPPEDATGRNELLEAMTAWWAQRSPAEPTRLLSEALDLSDKRMAAAERAAKEGA